MYMVTQKMKTKVLSLGCKINAPAKIQRQYALYLVSKKDLYGAAFKIGLSVMRRNTALMSYTLGFETIKINLRNI